LELANHNGDSPLAGKLTVEVYTLQDGYEQGDKVVPTLLKSEKGAYVVKHGTWLLFRIKNGSDRTLKVTAMDLAPDWKVSKVYPRNSDFNPIDAGKFEDVILSANLPNGYSSGMDTLKVFGTLGTASFRQLELPSLDQKPLVSKGAVTRGAASELDTFLAAISADAPPTRSLDQPVNASYEWTMTSVQVQISSS
jgi:hypothetical protein